MQSLRTIKRSIDNTAKLAGLLTAAALVGAMVILGGCNAVSGLGRDIQQTSDMLHRGIKTYYTRREGRERAGVRMVKDKNGIERLVGE